MEPLAIVEAVSKGTIQGFGSLFPKTIEQLDTCFSKIIYKVNQLCGLSETEKKNVSSAIYEVGKIIQKEESGDYLPIIPDIGIPLLEKLSFIEGPLHREAYIRLLYKASRKEDCKNIHPKLLTLLQSLSEEEIVFLRDLSCSRSKSLLKLSYVVCSNETPDRLYSTIWSFLPLEIEKKIRRPNITLANCTSLGLLDHEPNKMDRHLRDKLEDFVDLNFEKIGNSREHLRFKRDSNEWDSVRGCLPKEDSYNHLTIDSEQYSLSGLGKILIESIGLNSSSLPPRT